MIPFRDLPIRRKVASVVILTSAIALLLTSVAFMTHEWITFRHAALVNVTTLGRIIADNSTAALRFRNEADVQATLATLRAEPDIVSAAIYDLTSRPVAIYLNGRAIPSRLDEIPPGQHRFADRHLVVYQPVNHGDRPLGTLRIESSLTAMQRQFVLLGGIVVLILLTSSCVAFALSARLQERITAPVQELARTAQAITAQGDYSQRAKRYGNDELGALTDAFNLMLDEIKEREARLTASEERLRVALSAAEMGTWRYDPEKRESIVDENFRRIYGLPAGNGIVRGEEMLAQVHPEDRAPVRAALDRALHGPGAQYFSEYRVLHADGTLRWVRDRGRVVRRADGAVEYVTGALVDITDRKEAEQEIQRLNAGLELRVAERTAELAQANKELEAFTYSVSHDLRGPLRHIAGYAELIREDTENQLSADGQSGIERITRAAEKLSRLVDSLLNLSRIGRQPLVVQLTRLDELVDAARRELETDARGRQIEWRREPLPTLTVDPALMGIVFVNLLSNALKYTRPRPTVIVSIGTEIVEGRRVVFVRDNGVGFDPRFKSKLFGVFERLHSASAFEGTGVGLATVDRIIRKHGGQIWADGETDRGATFYFTLPGL